MQKILFLKNYFLYYFNYETDTLEQQFKGYNIVSCIIQKDLRYYITVSSYSFDQYFLA